MTIQLDHTIVPARNRDASAKQLADLLGVPWGPASVGPFAEVYINEGTTLDFQQTDEPFPVYHFCFRVGSGEFAAILERLRAAKVKFRSRVDGPDDDAVGSYGQVYWTEPEGHMWEILQVSYARQPRP